MHALCQATAKATETHGKAKTGPVAYRAPYTWIRTHSLTERSCAGKHARHAIRRGTLLERLNLMPSNRRDDGTSFSVTPQQRLPPEYLLPAVSETKIAERPQAADRSMRQPISAEGSCREPWSGGQNMAGSWGASPCPALPFTRRSHESFWNSTTHDLRDELEYDGLAFLGQ